MVLDAIVVVVVVVGEKCLGAVRSPALQVGETKQKHQID